MTPPSPDLLSERSRSWGQAMADAVFATLALPWAWPVALAGFLARGGIVVLLLPVVVMPTTSGLANAVAPALTPLVFGEPSAALDLLVIGLVALLVVALAVGGLVGAWADLALLRAAPRDLIAAAPLREPRWLVWRSFVARLLAHVPLAVALAWGAIRVVDAAYRELTVPDEVQTLLAVRILRDVPDAVAIIAAAWLLGEAAGGLAARRLITSRSSSAGALAWSIGRLVRQPLGAVATLVVTTTVVVVALLAALVPPAIAWHAVAVLLASAASAAEVGAAVVLFVTLWLVGLVIVAAATAFRAFAWTFVARRDLATDRVREADATVRARTIGGGGDGRPGEWPAGEPSGRL